MQFSMPAWRFFHCQMTSCYMFCCEIVYNSNNYDHIMDLLLRLASYFNEKEVMYNLRCGIWKLILSSALFGDPLVLQSSNSVAKTNTLHLLWLYSSTCEDKVRLLYAIKFNKFYCNLTLCKLNTYLILTRINPPYLPA